MAITDVFFRRYSDVIITAAFRENDRRFLFQATKLLGDRLWLGAPEQEENISDTSRRFLKIVHDRIAMELGVENVSPKFFYYKLPNGATQSWEHKIEKIISNFMNEKFDATKHEPDSYMKFRLSLVELAFRIRGEQVQSAARQFSAKLADAEAKDKAWEGRAEGLRAPGTAASGARALHRKVTDGYASVVDELNERLKLAGIPLVYSNGLLHLLSDELSNDVIAKPFWGVVSLPLWSNVDFHMKEAFDKRDRGERDAAFAALQALESTIKIISDAKGWTTGKEKGAHNYIDNLGSKANGNWIADWERDALKSLFTEVRNPFGHGPGNEPMPALSREQTDWTIDTAMAWIKSLVRRP